MNSIHYHIRRTPVAGGGHLMRGLAGLPYAYQTRQDASTIAARYVRHEPDEIFDVEECRCTEPAVWRDVWRAQNELR
jgi:hypothetical protein